MDPEKDTPTRKFERRFNRHLTLTATRLCALPSFVHGPTLQGRRPLLAHLGSQCVPQTPLLPRGPNSLRIPPHPDRSSAHQTSFTFQGW